jgi:hypothetical protein
MPLSGYCGMWMMIDGGPKIKDFCVSFSENVKPVPLYSLKSDLNLSLQ